MSFVKIAEEILVKTLAILSKIFAIPMEPVKLGKIPELDKSEVRKAI